MKNETRRRTYALNVSTCIKIDKIAILSCHDKSAIVDAAIMLMCNIISNIAENNNYDYKHSTELLIDEIDVDKLTNIDWSCLIDVLNKLH